MTPGPSERAALAIYQCSSTPYVDTNIPSTIFLKLCAPSTSRS